MPPRAMARPLSLKPQAALEMAKIRVGTAPRKLVQRLPWLQGSEPNDRQTPKGPKAVHKINLTPTSTNSQCRNRVLILLVWSLKDGGNAGYILSHSMVGGTLGSLSGNKCDQL